MDNIELLEVQAKNIEKEVNKIKGKEKGSIGRIYYYYYYYNSLLQHKT